MIDFFASLTVGLIIIMTLVIFISNYRQAQVLHQMKNVVKTWVDSQLRDRREERRNTITIKDPLKWFGNQVDLVLTDLQRTLEDPPAIEFLAEQGKRLVVSPLSPHHLRGLLRSIESRQRKLKHLVEPLLGARWKDVKVIQKKTGIENEWFDIEAAAAAKALKVSWPDYSYLWFYVISPRRPQEESWLRVEMGDFRDWINERKVKLITWFKTQFSKSSS